jgi:hypothetical protein
MGLQEIFEWDKRPGSLGYVVSLAGDTHLRKWSRAQVLGFGQVGANQTRLDNALGE